MNDTRTILIKTQAECIEYGNWLRNRIPDSENCFAMLHNHAMSAQEILDSIGHLRVRTEKQANQRIMLVLRSAWVFSLSVVEYSMKKIIRESMDGPLVKWYHELKERPHVVGAKSGYSLRSVIVRSHELDIVTDEYYQNWISLQYMRNAIIHNNAVVEERSDFTVGEYKMTIEAGEMVRSTHLDRAIFIQLIPTMSRNWIESFLDQHEM